MAKPIVVVVPQAPAKATKSAFNWEATLANLLNVPYSKNVKKFFDAWHSADNSNATNNPFNITIDYTGTSTGDMAGNSANIKNFPSALEGLIATAQFIQKRTPDIVAALGKGDYQGAATAIQTAGWAPSDPSYGAHIFQNYQNGVYTIGNNAPTQLSPKDKTDIQLLGQTYKATSPEAAAAAAASAATSMQLKLAKDTAHISDPWVTVLKKNGRVTGLGEAYGPNPPKNALTEGGAPLTKSEYTYSWAAYSDIFQQFTGRLATPGEIAQTLSDGLSTYALKAKLAGAPGFKASPIYQQSGAEVTTYMRQALGKAPAPTLVAQALANNWSQGEIDAKLRELPDYEATPAFKQAAAPLHNVYSTIYGNPDATGQQWIRNAALNGWTQDQAAAALRADPAYKYSPEYQAKAVNFLDAMGLFTGTRPVASVQNATVVKQETAGTKVGAPLHLQIGMGSQ